MTYQHDENNEDENEDENSLRGVIPTKRSAEGSHAVF